MLTSLHGHTPAACEFGEVLPPVAMQGDAAAARPLERLGHRGGAKRCTLPQPSTNICFAPGEHPQTRISIHPCYKRCRDGAKRSVGEGDFGRAGVGLCRILDMNFREFFFYELR